MNLYTDQPKEPPEVEIDESHITDIIKDSLPECRINEWFLESIYFANMVDEIVISIRESNEYE